MRLADLRGRGVYAGYPDRYRCIFVHIPKNGGSSIAQSLFGLRVSHHDYERYERVNPRKFRDYFKFCFVRNPWDRLVSGFFYLRFGAGIGNRTGSEDQIEKYNDFQSFVSGWLTEDNVRSSLHFKSQYPFICDRSMRVQMDFVGRIENITADFKTICEHLNIKAELQRLNMSDHRHYSEYYTAKLREMVSSVYAEDIAIFGYRFESLPAAVAKILAA
jgi:hypothetical protein